MLARAYPFDTVQMPLNCFDATYRSFEHQVRGFTPMSASEMQTLRERCAAYAADGHLELYKSTKQYDGGLGRDQHGYPPSKELPY
jgi:hypothetical protein